MTVASSQVEYARFARSYTLLIAVGLMVADAVVRIELFGMSRRRLLALAGATFFTLLTHYFCIGALCGVGLFVLWKSDRQRWPLLATMAAAAMLFAVVWGPFMWQQRYLFATDDPATLFLTGHDPNHPFTTTMRLLMVPGSMLSPLLGLWGSLALAGLVYFVPLFVLRKTWICFWLLWLGGTVGAIACLDLARQTHHLAFGRYVLLASPAVYALISILAASISRRRWIGYTLAGGLFLYCASGVTRAYARPSSDPRLLSQALLVPPGKDDLILFSTSPSCDLFGAQLNLLTFARYNEPIFARAAILTRPPTAEVLAAAHRARLIFLFVRENEVPGILPGAKILSVKEFPGFANVFTLRFFPAK